MDTLARRYPRQSLAVWQARDQLAPDDRWALMEEAVDLHIARAAWSRRQLLEVLADFWSNHLNVTCPSSDVWDSRHLYARDVVRKHALGTFSDMLVASARHPAMLAYLDNATSSKKAPNENHGRELLELHTVGVDGGYTEKDVRSSALHPHRPVGGLRLGRVRVQADPPLRGARDGHGLLPRELLGPHRRGGGRRLPEATSPGTRRRRAGSPGSSPSASSPTHRPRRW